MYMTNSNFTPEEIKNFFSKHFTARKYKNYEMPKEHLDTLLYAAQRAPTDATAQMYSIIRITDKAIKEKLANLTNNPHMATASESFIMCADIHRLKKILNAHDYELGNFPHTAIHFAVGDIVMAGENLLLAAEMLGYMGCWIGGVMRSIQEISDLLKLPKGVFPFAGLTIGVPDEESKHRPRLYRDQVVHENKYREYSKEELKSSTKEMAAITARGDWALTLNGYFGEGGAMEEREIDLSKYLKKQIFDK